MNNNQHTRSVHCTKYININNAKWDYHQQRWNEVEEERGLETP